VRVVARLISGWLLNDEFCERIHRRAIGLHHNSTLRIHGGDTISYGMMMESTMWSCNKDMPAVEPAKVDFILFGEDGSTYPHMLTNMISSKALSRQLTR
jgi:hypothetical protein